MVIEFEHHPASKSNPAKVSLSVKGDGKTLHLDTVDLAKEDQRSNFIKNLCGKFPGLEGQKGEIAEQLLGLAQSLLVAKESEGDTKEDVVETPLELSEKALAETDEELVA